MPATRFSWPAARRGVDALDVVFSDINDEEGLREDTALPKIWASTENR